VLQTFKVTYAFFLDAIYNFRTNDVHFKSFVADFWIESLPVILLIDVRHDGISSALLIGARKSGHTITRRYFHTIIALHKRKKKFSFH
jgi:hypothetical protein